MKKYLLALSVIILLASGCSSSQQTNNQPSSNKHVPVVCSATEHSCSCADGNYCLPISAMCINPTSACFTSSPNSIPTATSTATNPSIIKISALSPTSGPVDTIVTITGSGFTPTGNKIMFGNLGSENNPSYDLSSADGKTLVFNVPSSNYYACEASSPPCYPPNIITQPGTYTVSVINANGSSNSQNFIVTQEK